MFTFDGNTKIIALDTGVRTFTTTELYSEWKDWVMLSDNSKFEQAMRAIGNEPLSPTNNSPAFFFLMNGWRIQPEDVNHVLTIDGNLLVDGGVGDLFVFSGSSAIQIQQNTSIVPGVSSSGSGRSHLVAIEYQELEAIVSIPTQSAFSFVAEIWPANDSSKLADVTLTEVVDGYRFTYTFSNKGWYKLKANDGQGDFSYFHIQVRETTKNLLVEISESTQNKC